LPIAVIAMIDAIFRVSSFARARAFLPPALLDRRTERSTPRTACVLEILENSQGDTESGVISKKGKSDREASINKQNPPASTGSQHANILSLHHHHHHSSCRVWYP